MTGDPLAVLSFGAGVQSTAVLVLALEGELAFDVVIFADTGWEPRAVYAHLWAMAERCVAAGLQLVVVSGGDVRAIAPLGQGSALDVPFHLRNPDGTPGILRRQCTSKLKVAPIRAELRRWMGRTGAARVVQSFGISVDEVQRMRTSDVRYITNAYPLIDRGMTRHDCARFLATRGIVAPRSACIGCPYHSDAEWRKLTPDEFGQAVEWESDVQRRIEGVRGVPFLHRSLVPLSTVDLTTPEDHGQLVLDGTWEDECSGLCGV